MTIARWKPFGDLYSLHDRITRLFEDEYLKDPEKRTSSLATWYPVTDIVETESDYVLKLEVAGLGKDDVHVEFAEGTLTIKGERKEEKETEKENYLRVERFSGAFYRSFTLPKNVDADRIKASMQNGILELRIPKAEEKKAKSIPINV